MQENHWDWEVNPAPQHPLFACKLFHFSFCMLLLFLQYTAGYAPSQNDGLFEEKAQSNMTEISFSGFWFTNKTLLA